MDAIPCYWRILWVLAPAVIPVRLINAFRLRYWVRPPIFITLPSRFQGDLYCRGLFHCAIRRCARTSSNLPNWIFYQPCAFIAANYVLLGRIAKFLACTEYIPLPINKITLIFVISDVNTFLIQVVFFASHSLIGRLILPQAGGGTLSISQNAKISHMGSYVSFLPTGYRLRLIIPSDFFGWSYSAINIIRHLFRHILPLSV